jgi:acetyl esterase/lipase
MIVLVHGGGFMAGSKDDPDMQGYAKAFVKTGYVVAVVNYRLASPAAPALVCSGYQPWLALQDLHAALNHITANSSSYRVDPDKIFLLGTSAGAVTVLHAVYADDDELLAWCPRAYPVLGGKTGLDKYPGLPVKIAGIAVFSGGIYRSEFYDASNSVPSMMIHGTADTTVPYCVGRSTVCFGIGPVVYGAGWIIEKIKTDSPARDYRFYQRCGFGHAYYAVDHVPAFHAIGTFFADIMDGVLPASESINQFVPNQFPCGVCAP